MKKSLFIMALGAIALTSCSQDEVIEVQKDAISFAAFSDNASRATETTTATINSFKVWGVSKQDGGILYIPGVVYNRSSAGAPATGQWVEYDSGYYWPAGEMNFWSVSPSDVANVELADDYDDVTISNYTAGAASGDNYDATSQVDLLYAVAADQTKATDAGNVDLHFNHALSQVEFKVKVDATFPQDIDVTVNNVKINKLSTTETFTFNIDGTAQWTTTAATKKDYIVESFVGDANTIDYTVGTAKETGLTTSMFVIPQAKNTAATQSAGVWDANGLFILDADIKTTTTGGDVVNLVTDEPTYVPVTFNWQPGYKYVYTFIYTKTGNGGVDQEGNDQLVKILLTCDVIPFAPTTPAETPVPLQ